MGSVIADTYTIEAMIGRGGMGAVFMASHARLPGKNRALGFLAALAQTPIHQFLVQSMPGLSHSDYTRLAACSACT